MKSLIFVTVFLVVGGVFFSSSVIAKVDCSMPTEKRLKYLHNNHGVDLGVDKPLPGCPGWDDIDPGFANLEIEGIKFRIPRDFIAFDHKQADGPSGRVILGIGIRSFNDWRHMLIDEKTTNIFLFRDHKRQSCGSRRCYSSEYLELLALITGFRLKSILEDPDKFYTMTRNFLENAKLGIGKFLRFSVAENKGLFIAFQKEKDDITNWYICSQERNFCDSKTKILSNIYMSLGRDFIGLDDFESFRDKVENTLLPRFIEE